MIDAVEMIITFIKLGMSLERACLAIGLSEEDEQKFTEDPEFQREIEQTYACLERDLLERHAEAAKVQENKGGTHAAEWMLERINPKRWAKSTTIVGPGNSVPERPTLYLPANGR